MIPDTLPALIAQRTRFAAVAQLSAVAVAVNTRFRSHEFADILHRSRSRLLVFWPGFKGIDFAGILAACDAHALEHLESLVVYDESGANPPPTLLGKPALAYRTLAGSAPLLESRATPDSGCVIFTTSGTAEVCSARSTHCDHACIRCRKWIFH